MKVRYLGFLPSVILISWSFYEVLTKGFGVNFASIIVLVVVFISLVVSIAWALGEI